MQYIKSTPNESGAYPGPQSNPFPGALALTDEQVATLIQHNGFVNLTAEKGLVTSVTPNTESWEAWKASLPPKQEPEPTPQEDTDALMVDHEYRLTLLELGVEKEVN